MEKSAKFEKHSEPKTKPFLPCKMMANIFGWLDRRMLETKIRLVSRYTNGLVCESMPEMPHLLIWSISFWAHANYGKFHLIFRNRRTRLAIHPKKPSEFCDLKAIPKYIRCSHVRLRPAISVNNPVPEAVKNFSVSYGENDVIHDDSDNFSDMDTLTYTISLPYPPGDSAISFMRDVLSYEWSSEATVEYTGLNIEEVLESPLVQKCSYLDISMEDINDIQAVLSWMTEQNRHLHLSLPDDDDDDVEINLDTIIVQPLVDQLTADDKPRSYHLCVKLNDSRNEARSVRYINETMSETLSLDVWLVFVWRATLLRSANGSECEKCPFNRFKKRLGSFREHPEESDNVAIEVDIDHQKCEREKESEETITKTLLPLETMTEVFRWLDRRTLENRIRLTSRCANELICRSMSEVPRLRVDRIDFSAGSGSGDFVLIFIRPEMPSEIFLKKPIPFCDAKNFPKYIVASTVVLLSTYDESYMQVELNQMHILYGEYDEQCSCAYTYMLPYPKGENGEIFCREILSREWSSVLRCHEEGTLSPSMLLASKFAQKVSFMKFDQEAEHFAPFIDWLMARTVDGVVPHLEVCLSSEVDVHSAVIRPLLDKFEQDTQPRPFHLLARSPAATEPHKRQLKNKKTKEVLSLEIFHTENWETNLNLLRSVSDCSHCHFMEHKWLDGVLL